jgi:hypothetical protein
MGMASIPTREVLRALFARVTHGLYDIDRLAVKPEIGKRVSDLSLPPAVAALEANRRLP